MPRKDGRIEAGQKIRTAISAAAWNRAQDAADLVLGNRYSATAGESRAASRAVNSVLVRNDTGCDLTFGGVMRVSGVVINPSGGTIDGEDSASNAARAFVDVVVLIGVVPTEQATEDRFVVCVEPIKSGAIGRAAISGCFACRVYVTRDDHLYATIKDNETTHLQSALCGTVQLLWKESGTDGVKWAVGVM